MIFIRKMQWSALNKDFVWRLWLRTLVLPICYLFQFKFFSDQILINFNFINIIYLDPAELLHY